MGYNTAAGSAIAFSAGTPATQDQSGFAALTFTEVGGVEKIGGFGASFAKVDFQPLKGSVDYGSLQPSIGIDESDAGQTLMRTAADDATNKLYATKVTKQNGAVRYFMSRVFGFQETVDGADTVDMATPAIEICSPIVRVAAA